MEYCIHSHRDALTILENDPTFTECWQEIRGAIEGISDDMIIENYEGLFRVRNKSLSTTINHLLKQEFLSRGWAGESPIFQEKLSDMREGDYWRLDFAKGDISIEVAFNHSGTTAWNLLKPVLASELNHVEKAIQTRIGVIICATKAMKSAGNFDGAIGTYEKYVTHLRPLMNQLSVPLLIIGLEAPESFRVTSAAGRGGLIVRKTN
ncbi:hypothetical protein RIF24_16395 (plasmid) [Exiguobacterium acetylicum]|uniref:BglII/BstYI family type II restriction endonuclease n=2 Tax=Exiguobacterium TaxID=33986 RepID=UPI003977371F